MSRVKGSESPFSHQETRDKAVQTNIERYGVDNPFKSKEIKEKIIQTNLNRYGVDNPFKSKEIQEHCRKKFRETITKRKQRQYDELEFVIPDWDSIKGTRTMSESGIRIHYPKFYEYIIEHYPQDIQFKEKLWLYRNGLDNPPVCKVCGGPVRFTSNDCYSKYCSSKCANSDPDKKEKTKHVVLERYQKESVSQVPEIREKVKKTTLEHYGVDHISKSPKIQKKIRETCKQKYGVEYVTQSSELREKIKKSTLEHHGVEYGVLVPSAKLTSNNSKPNNDFSKKLDNLNIPYEREFRIIKYSYDFRVDDTLIEINPTITHNINFNPWSDPKSKTYHADKTKTANNHNYKCIHVWDWDDTDKIINLLTPKTKIGARNCKIREVSKKDSLKFLEINHVQGKVRGITISIGLYYQDKLVGIMCFGKPRYAKGITYELLRLCFDHEVTISGGSQKMYKYFLKQVNPDSVISYCDKSKFSGDIYNELDFTEESTNISKHWYNVKTKQHITDNMLRAYGFDHIFHTNYGKGTSNEDLMREHGFLEVYDCGQTSYIWNKNKKALPK